MTGLMLAPGEECYHGAPAAARPRLLDDADRGREPLVRRRSADENLNRPRLSNPGASSLIPISERTRLKWDTYRASLPARNRHALEATKLFQGTLNLRAGNTDIELHNLLAI